MPIVKNRVHNIPQLYIIKLAKWLMLTMPIVFLFYHVSFTFFFRNDEPIYTD